MRLHLPLLIVLLAGCATQQRPDYVDDDRWANHQPQLDTYDRSYVPPNRRDAPALVRQAQQAEHDGRDDKARVDYQQAFLRDRWHVEANTRYQDLMLRNGLDEILWREYLDLWFANERRGDAMWFHLRPLMLERGSDPNTATSQAEIPAEVAAALESADDPVQVLEKALTEYDVFDLHRMLIATWPNDKLAELQRRYAERAEDDPSEGDALALHALAAARTDRLQALKLLREGYVLGLPGVALRVAFAELCADMANELGTQTRGQRRQAAGWYRCAESLLAQAHGEGNAKLQEVRKSLSRLASAGLDG